ncbi:hypothetical protein T233_00623 [Vagococcus lutrae LBD1]|uniref:Glycosyl transferase family 1 domain-containing protein n=1 Tax=Vagococcus lutrae LBD1 TaxID=1408226 RepID=V6Q6N5_9ENTE|nr:glycosyltransferase [Vagococcus lutrae]EST90320.1 hypothetical protein T233_00623 [Vagococcus lutrae LBD1]
MTFQKKNDALLLVTNYYPYHKGEEYLESEIEYLANEFDKVFIAPTMVQKDMKKTRKVPNNCQVINTIYSGSKIEKLFQSLKRTNMCKEKNIKYRIYTNYFENRSQLMANKVLNQLDGTDFLEYENHVIYSYWLYTTARISVILKEKLIPSSKVVTRAHRYDLYEEESPFKFLPLREKLLEDLDYVYPCSDDGTNYLKEKYPLFSNKIITKRLGTEAPKKMNNLLENGVVHIVSVSACRKVKRLDRIIESLKILNDNNIKFYWTHIGDGPEKENLLDMAKEYLPTESFRFLGFLPNAEVKAFYERNSVDLFLNVSESEGVPVSIMEAMSYGIPIIATDVGGTREIVKNKVNGYLIKKDFSNEELLRIIMKYCATNSSEKIEIRNKSFEIWNNYSNCTNLYKDFSIKLKKRIY